MIAHDAVRIGPAWGEVLRHLLGASNYVARCLSACERLCFAQCLGQGCAVGLGHDVQQAEGSRPSYDDGRIRRSGVRVSWQVRRCLGAARMTDELRMNLETISRIDSRCMGVYATGSRPTAECRSNCTRREFKTTCKWADVAY